MASPGSEEGSGVGAAADEVRSDATAAASEAAEQGVGRLEEAADQVAEKLGAWLEGGIAMLPNLAVAILLVLAFALAGRILGRGAHRAAVRAGNDQLAALASVAVRVGVTLVGLFVALGVLQLEKTVTSLLAGVGVAGIALGFAFQDIAANFMSGTIMAVRRPFVNGDWVQTHDCFGVVEEVSLRATVVRLWTGEDVIIPNKEVLANPITNYTRHGKRRIDVDVGVDYDSDLETARRVALEALEALEGRDESRPVEFYYRGFGASSIDFSARFWIDLRGGGLSWLEAQSRGVMAVKAAFDAHGITIPFPIRTLDVRAAAEDTPAALPLRVLDGSGEPRSAEPASRQAPRAASTGGGST